MRRRDQEGGAGELQWPAGHEDGPRLAGSHGGSSRNPKLSTRQAGIVAIATAFMFLPLISAAAAAGGGFYKRPALFRLTRPGETAERQVIGRFGPVGMAIELRQPAFQMGVLSVEADSPAAATGRLKPGQRIDSINGRVLKDVDPRITLGDIVTEAEATDGRVALRIRDTEDGEPYDVVVQIPVLGAYSDTWPLNCPKSDRIVRNLADHLAEHGSFPFPAELAKGERGPTGVSLTGFGALFLLSTGEERDLDVVRGWMDQVVEQTRDYEKIRMKPWDYAPGALPIAEYYLRTGDARVLPILQGLADHARNTLFNGGWSGRGGLVFGYAGCGGHMNAAGVHVATFLLLAKQCGVEVDERSLLDSLRNFYRYAGRGSLGYGDGFPETYFIDNGKTSALAYTMAAAVSLIPDGENSVYAGARDISAMRGFYGSSYMNVGHTGGGIGEAWRGAAMGYLYDKEPEMYRGFMDGRRWHLELSRRFDGSIGILDGSSRYDRPDSWGRMVALQYTFPRKTLQISGAPNTKHSHTHTLPERPWGTAADDDFCQTGPAALPDGTIPAFDNTLEGGTIGGIEESLWRMRDDGGIPADVVFTYGHHPEHEVRREIFGFYRPSERVDAIAQMLTHDDARVRRTALTGIHHVHKGTHTLPPEMLTEEMVERVVEMINDDQESWWVVENALRVLSILPEETVAPHLDRLLLWLRHDEWWLQFAAITALTPLAANERYADRILPVVGEVIVSNTHAQLLNAVQQLASKLAGADSEEVRDAAWRMLARAYREFPARAEPPAGEQAHWELTNDLASHFPTISMRSIAYALRPFPSGYAQLLKLARDRQPHMLADYMTWVRGMNFSGRSPEVRQEMEALVRDLIIPDYVGRHYEALNRGAGEVTGEPLAGLAELYATIGEEQYRWRDFGPGRDRMEFHYYSFDPVEERVWQPGQVRHRNVTVPAGMEAWHQPAFDPAQAGWQTGLAPFGQVEGRLRTEQGGCRGGHCGCGDPMNTLWEREVLLLKGRFTFPDMKPGHSYRLLAGGAVHVGNTDGPVVHLDGQRVFNAVAGIRRGMGGRPRGILLNQAQVAQFNSGEVDISAIGFLRQHLRSGEKGNFLTIFVQEMKHPPFTEEMARKGRRLMAREPMASSAWQALQDPESRFADDDPNEGTFLHDGIFVDDARIRGSWKLVGQVDAPEGFDPAAMAGPAVRPFDGVAFEDNGSTDSLDRFWSGDMLMNVVTKEAVRIDASHIGRTGHLLIEAGGFDPGHPKGWTSPWLVLERRTRDE